MRVAMSSRLPEIPAKRLLKSCASPPVSWPTASIFWDWRGRASGRGGGAERRGRSVVGARAEPPRELAHSFHLLGLAERRLGLSEGCRLLLSLGHVPAA